MIEAVLAPGWLRRDTQRAAEQIAIWLDARDERAIGVRNTKSGAEVAPSAAKTS